MKQILKIGIRTTVVVFISFTVYSLTKKFFAEREELYLKILKES